MKKTLVALAVLAASGASFAQVTITGGAAFAYQATSTDSVTNSGFVVDTSEIYFSATEDLGGGTKVSANMNMGGLDRGGYTPTGGGVAGQDFSVSVAGGFGKVLLGSIEIGSGIRGLAQAGAPVNNMEGEVLPAAGNADIVKYTAPAMGGLTLSGSHTEAVGANGFGAGSSRAVTIGADYAAGALAAKLDMSKWTSNAAADSRYRIAASYNLGAAKIGAGYEDTTLLNSAGNIRATMIGLSAPVGATTLGAAWVRNDTTGAARVRTGVALGASYALSKRTSLGAQFTSWDSATSTDTNTKTYLTLGHSF